MYSVVVVQETLQRRQEPWRWEVSAVGSWQWQLRAIIEADLPTTTQEVAEELNVDHSSHLAFEANWKGEKGW